MSAPVPLEPLPLIVGQVDDVSLTTTLFDPVFRETPRGWWLLFGLCLSVAGVYLGCVLYTLANGIGVWGNNSAVGWAFGIINFVWWIGIGHAGTLISAILLLLQQKWRTSINRFAEAMTLFAVLCAAVYPLLHTGRPWFGYWLLPYPSTLKVWPNFKSPLVWDVFAITTYGTVSFLFWYVGLIPDLAALRDTARSPRARRIYGVFALGWRGAASHWRHWKVGYLLLAGIATPLVVSVHTIVSFDFAASVIPGWHTTIFPPYFVAGAVFSGFAMVVTLIIPARKFLRLEHVITLRHLESMNKVILVTGLLVSYGYLCEHFIAWYSGNPYERFVFANRAVGPYARVYWLMLTCNVLVPQLFWSQRLRRSLPVMFGVSLLVNVGMWCERFIIVVTSLHRDFLPSSWAEYSPTWVDWGLFIGSLGVFGTLFLLFLRFLPPVAASEVKELAQELATPHAEVA
jgi:Ni/Fe-hydrogenase subunit HybB-like protein